MPAVIVWLISALAPLFEYAAGRLLVLLGFTLVTYTGLDTALTFLTGQAQTSIGGVTGYGAALLNVLMVPQTVSLVIATITAKLAMTALSGTISKWVAGAARA
jgi:hypothetical protein